MKSSARSISRLSIGITLISAVFIPLRPVLAFSSNSEHELGVYSLYEYGVHDGLNWKSTVRPSHSKDPAGAFWEIMTTGAGSEYAYTTSKRRLNADVNIHTIFPIAGDGWKDWDQFDFVFFYGHNNMLVPPHPAGTHSFWSNNSGEWNHVDGRFPDWGTLSLPYEYYWEDVTSGQRHPGSVVYLHEPFTSALLGYHFEADASSTYQSTAQDRPDGNSRTESFSSGLGDNDLEWLILHGCQALIVADEEGGGYERLAADAFRRTYGKFHIILGHYSSFGVSQLRGLDGFAYDLLAGVPIQQAYFQTDPAQNTSALSAECIPLDLPSSQRLTYIIENGYMNNDTWTQPIPDNHNCQGRRIWYARWIRKNGTWAYDW